MRAALLVACLGCGRVAFDPSGDAAPEPAECWELWNDGVPAFTEPEDITPFDTAGRDHDPVLTDDGLTLYFSSGRPPAFGGDDMFVSTRATRTSPFLVPEHIPSLSSAGDDGLFFSRDGLTGVLAVDVASGQSYELAAARRVSLADPFTVTRADFMSINSAVAEFDAWQSLDGLRLYFSRAGLIEMASRALTSDPFGTGQIVNNIWTDSGEFDVSLSPDERVIVFSSYRNGFVKRDVFAAIRPTRLDPFGAPIGIPVLSSPTFENYDPHVSADGCEIVLASDRGRALGDLGVFVSRVIR